MTSWKLFLLVLIKGAIICDVEAVPTMVATELVLFTKREPWNAAHYICRSVGRQLVIIDNESKHAAVRDVLHKLYQESSNQVDDIWLGIASLKAGGSAYTSVSCANQTYFRWKSSQPDNLNSDFCVRWMYDNSYGFRDWGTDSCSMEHDYVCERPIGYCWFEGVQGRSLAATGYSKQVADVQTCRNLCQYEFISPGQQCAAVHFNSYNGECTMEMATKLHVTDLYTSYSYPAEGSYTLFTRRCYNYTLYDIHIPYSISGNIPDLTCDPPTTTTPATTTVSTTSTTSQSTSKIPTSVSTAVPTADTTQGTSVANEISTAATPHDKTSTATEVLTTGTTEKVTSMTTEVTTHGTTEEVTEDVTEVTEAGTTEEMTSVAADVTTASTVHVDKLTTAAVDTSTASTTQATSAASEATTTGTTEGTSWSTEGRKTEVATIGSPESGTSAATDTTASSSGQHISSPSTSSDEKSTSGESKTSMAVSTEKQPVTSSPTSANPPVEQHGQAAAKAVCSCRCAQKNGGETQAAIAAVQRELHVPKEELSSSKRKLTSAPDVRLSAHTLGWVGVSFLGGLLALLVLLDCVRLARFLHDRYREGRLSA